MATFGYGDIHPQSAAGKILALVLIVGGVRTFLGFGASVTGVTPDPAKFLLRMLENPILQEYGGFYFIFYIFIQKGSIN